MGFVYLSNEGIRCICSAANSRLLGRMLRNLVFHQGRHESGVSFLLALFLADGLSGRL